jgi:hypothetical protein
VKRKFLARIKSELWDRLQPEVNPATLANDINEFLRRHAGRDVNFAHNLVAYLTQKYSVSDRNSGELRQLIEEHSDDLAAFLDGISVHDIGKNLESLTKIIAQIPRTKKPRTESEAARRRKRSKNRYEWRRRQYRDGLIIKQFGTIERGSVLDPRRKTRPSEGPCLDILFRGGAIRMAGHADSLENLFGVDRHRCPKALPHKRSGRNKVYYLDAFVECLIHLLANRDGYEQWLNEPRQRKLVLRGIIRRARRFSSETGNMLAERLRPYLP